MLLRCCLINLNMIILRQFLYLVYLCPCLDLGLFMSDLGNLFFIFIFMFITIYQRFSLKWTHLFFAHFLEYALLFLDHNVNEETEWFSNSKSSVSGRCLVFAWFFANFSHVLLIKVFLLYAQVYSRLKKI